MLRWGADISLSLGVRLLVEFSSEESEKYDDSVFEIIFDESSSETSDFGEETDGEGEETLSPFIEAEECSRFSDDCGEDDGEAYGEGSGRVGEGMDGGGGGDERSEASGREAEE